MVFPEGRKAVEHSTEQVVLDYRGEARWSGGNSEFFDDGREQIPLRVVPPEAKRGQIRGRRGKWYRDGDMVGALRREGGLPTLDLG